MVKIVLGKHEKGVSSSESLLIPETYLNLRSQKVAVFQPEVYNSFEARPLASAPPVGHEPILPQA